MKGNHEGSERSHTSYLHLKILFTLNKSLNIILHIPLPKVDMKYTHLDYIRVTTHLSQKLKTQQRFTKYTKKQLFL